jgi:hypothetical protein
MPQNPDDGVLSHWYTLFEDFSTSTQDFYAAIEESIRLRKIPDVEVSRVLFSEGHVGTAKREYLRIRRGRIAVDICSAPYGTSHFFSWWVSKVPARYGLLKVLGLVFLLTPIWNIFLTLALKATDQSFSVLIFVSFLSFLGFPIILILLGIAVERGWIGNEEWVLSVPIIGYLYTLVFKPLTYYRIDTAYMFRDSISAVVGETVNALREEKGLRLLEEEELAPSVPKALAR